MDTTTKQTVTGERTAARGLSTIPFAISTQNTTHAELATLRADRAELFAQLNAVALQLTACGMIVPLGVRNILARIERRADQ